MFALDRYLERIGLTGDPGLAEVHRAHATAIPFENLDSQQGIPVSLDEGDLARKLVDACRGGYCFEQNLLLKAALTELGAEVELFLARVLLGADQGSPRPRSHLLLRVRIGGESWHADVGFGGGTLLEPLPWGPGEEHVQAGWRYRVRAVEHEYVLQTFDEDSWVDLYSFLPYPVLKADVEAVNWWTCTHPASRFVTGLLVGRQWQDGRRLVLSDWGELSLFASTPTAKADTVPKRAEVPWLLAQRFELAGFHLDPLGRIVGSPVEAI